MGTEPLPHTEQPGSTPRTPEGSEAPQRSGAGWPWGQSSGRRDGQATDSVLEAGSAAIQGCREQLLARNITLPSTRGPGLGKLLGTCATWCFAILALVGLVETQQFLFGCGG